MWVFVDVDGTLISKEDVPRPYVERFFRELYDLGCDIVVWSAGGEPYARNKIGMIERRNLCSIKQYVRTYLGKETRLIVPKPSVFIDDVGALLSHYANEGNYGFKVPFYEPAIVGEDDDVLLKAVEFVKAKLSAEDKGK